MNSLDAHATRADITVHADGFTIADDGDGLRSRAEILACFETFGFEHNDRARSFGQFGLGRAQLWNWCSTRWRTHGFRLDVDVRRHGFDYDLVQGLDEHPGLVIEGRFYEPLREVERMSLLRELDMLCRYCVIPVVVDGADIRQDPAAMKWTHEDDVAWIKATGGGLLAVYNQGILVRDYSAIDVGVGGVLVTKLGHSLALNMARSDVLTHECALWKRLRATCAGLAKRDVRSKTQRLTAERRDFLARTTVDPDGAAEDFEAALFTLTNGRNVTLQYVSRMLAEGAHLTTAAGGDRMAERAISERAAVVVSERTLERFDARTATQLAANLQERLQALYRAGTYRFAHVGRVLAAAIAGGRVADRFADCPIARQFEASIVPKAQWKPAHRRLLTALASVYPEIVRLVGAERDEATLVDAPRELLVGQSNAAEAFTDRASYIAISEKVLDVARGGRHPSSRRRAVLGGHAANPACSPEGFWASPLADLFE